MLGPAARQRGRGRTVAVEPSAFLRFLLSRIAKAVVVVLAIIVLNFVLIRLAPGDPASVIAGQSGAADPQFMEQLRRQFGLDRPLHEQLWIYVSRIVTLDLGVSHRQQRTVASLLAERLPATLLLTGSAFALSLLFGCLLYTSPSPRDRQKSRMPSSA